MRISITPFDLKNAGQVGQPTCPIHFALKRQLRHQAISIYVGTHAVSMCVRGPAGLSWLHVCASDLDPLPDWLALDGARILIMPADSPLFAAARRVGTGETIEPFTFDLDLS
jgi:hypothetical protein